MNLIKPLLTILVIFFASYSSGYSQCCAAGGGNPVASDISQSVLMKGQMEIGANTQFISTTKFLTFDQVDSTYLNRFASQYMYSKIAYGVTKELTVSVESGYWLEKMQVGVNNIDTVHSSGISDIIIFPRLNVYNKNNWEITTGLGIKFPIGSYNDSIGYYEPFSGETFYLTKPPAIQLSTGSNDFIFNLFVAKNFTKIKTRVFANATYIRKGWNPLGEKMGDYYSVSAIVAKSFFEKLSIMTHIKYEWINKMSINQDIMMVSFPNYDPQATGSKKLFIVPQINYSPFKNFSVFVFSEIPVYQYVNKTQIASQFQITSGITYRFQVKPADCCPKPTE